MYFLSRLSCLAVAALQLGLVTAAPTPVEDLKASELDRRLTAPEPACASVSSTNKRLFTFNGRTQYFAGTNAWWLGHLPSNVDVDGAVAQMAATGYKVARVWGFGSTNDPSKTQDVYYQVLNSSGQYFNYNPQNGIPRLDYAVAAAQKKGIQLILPLLNNWDELGGINTYTNIYGGTHNDFYTNAAAQAAYKNYIKFIVNRYKSSSAIFSWELCNEPRCSGCNPSIITKWASDISAYIKSLDSRHMVSLGDEGWLTSTSATTVPNYEQSYAYTGYEGVDFQANLAIKTLDYGTFHMYPQNWGYNYTWGNTWIAQHNAIGRALNKPVLLEEYAVPPGQDRVPVMQQWQDTVLTKTSVAGDMVWQFGTKFPSGATPLDEYALYWNSSEGTTLGYQHVKEMTGKRPVATL
ncbi:MAG: hypothetical protein L6R40_003186 [Gallowayella cf. fulva]|nr:MAG: hypothetical protein L6R40_003186 [Xanthomendoza cf. fulva]